MKSLMCLILVLSLAVVTDAAERVRAKLSDVICEVGARSGVVGKATAGEGVEVRVKDGRKAAKDCSATWYQTDVVCSGPVQFKGFGDCDKPVLAERVVTDCGTVKKTVVEFCSGKRVEISKNKGVVTVDYDN